MQLVRLIFLLAIGIHVSVASKCSGIPKAKLCQALAPACGWCGNATSGVCFDTSTSSCCETGHPYKWTCPVSPIVCNKTEQCRTYEEMTAYGPCVLNHCCPPSEPLFCGGGCLPSDRMCCQGFSCPKAQRCCGFVL